MGNDIDLDRIIELWRATNNLLERLIDILRGFVDALEQKEQPPISQMQ